jgi:hypothetical protein
LVISTFVYAQNVESTYIGTNSASGRPMYEYTFKIYKGWNLVPAVWYSRGDIGCGAGEMAIDNRMVSTPENQHLKYAFIWTPTKGYVGGYLDHHHTFDLTKFDEEELGYIGQAVQNIAGYNPVTGVYNPEAEVYISTYATWVYSDADCTLGRTEEGGKLQMEISTRNDTSSQAQYLNTDSQLPRIKLQKGWNIGMVLPLMFAGDKLSDYFSGCKIERFAIWDPDPQEWYLPDQKDLQDNLQLVSPTEENAGIGQETGSGNIQPSWYYRTFAIKVADQCSLGYGGT